MPLTPPGIVGSLTSVFPGMGIAGIGAPQLAAGIAAGVMLWTGALTVVTVDVGTAGAGTGLMPCMIPPPLLIAGMIGGLASTGNIGIMAVPLATAIGTGLGTAFPLGMIMTVHPTVGVGTATVTFPGPSAVPFMMTGFKSAGLIGMMADKLAAGVGMGLDTAFAGFTIPAMPIVGAASPVPSSGTGSGKII